jgi:adenosylmethionine-8-amino-7-oxononanoate aminotransferase
MDPARCARYPFIAAPGAVPFGIARTEGATLITQDGHRILDAAGGAVLVNIGHGRRDVAEVYARAVAEATYVVPPFATPDRVRLVERLLDRWLPEGITRAVFTSGGSESMDAAIRLARQHHVSPIRPGRPPATACAARWTGVTPSAGSPAPTRWSV